MTEPRLPPLRLNSPAPDTPRSNTSQSVNQSARERRRQRNNSLSRVPSAAAVPATTPSGREPPVEITPRTPRKSRPTSVNSMRPETTPTATDQVDHPTDVKRKPRKVTRKSVSSDANGHVNKGFVSDAEPVEAAAATTATENDPPKHRRSRKDSRKPPIKKRNRKFTNKSQTPNHVILNGLEDDVVAMDHYDYDDDDYSKENNNNNQPTTPTTTDKEYSDRSQKQLVPQSTDKLPQSIMLKSIPTDKYYLEYERKFQIQNKDMYEKRQEAKRINEIELELKLKQREEQKYQIRTPRTALRCHRILRLAFQFIHGLNVGFQFWMTIVINYVYLANDVPTFGNNAFFDIFRSLLMPFHCLTYFFLAICIVDVMDRVDFTKMTWKYLVKCLTVQNSFWSIVLYLVALVCTLALINVDAEAYLLANKPTGYNMTIVTTDTFQTWQSLSIVKTVMCSLAWLLFCIYAQYDMTFESLEKRDFSLLDDLLQPEQQQQQQQLEEPQKPSNIIPTAPTSSLA